VSPEDDHPVFDRGDVVFGADPFKRADAARPWLVISNHEGRPFHGEQYIAVTLTTKSWMDDLIEVAAEDWIRGGTPAESRIVPWGVQSIGREDIDRWQGRLKDEVVDEAIHALVAELEG
jgi:mRNA interferase MazF